MPLFLLITADDKLQCNAAGGAAYLFFMSRQLATAVAGVTALLWIVALRYGNFSRKAQRTYQDALAETNQVLCFKLFSAAAADALALLSSSNCFDQEMTSKSACFA